MENREIDLRWKVFAYYLLKGVSATEAYLRAGYQNTTRESAQAAASRLRKRPRFAAFFGEIKSRVDAERRRRTVKSIQRKLRHLSQIIRTSAGDVPRQRRSLITYQKTFRNGGRVTCLPDKLAALKKHSELAGHLDLTPDLPPFEDPQITKNPRQTITIPAAQGTSSSVVTR